MKKPDFPTYIDSTMRSSFVLCQRKFFNEYMLNRRGGGESVHLVAGKSFASGIEAARLSYWRDRNDPEQALRDGVRAMLKDYPNPERFEEENKSLPRMILALDAYFKQWGWEEDHIHPVMKVDGTPMVELGFALPIPGTAHPQTGEPVLYCGRYDMLGVHTLSGDIYAVDEKTTSALGATWPAQWKHRGQLTGYVWAGREFGYDVKGAWIRGISILKTKFGHAESPQIRTDIYIQRWLEQMKHDVEDMIQAWEKERWNFNFSDSCTSFMSPCAYTDSCASRDPEAYTRTNFDHHRWNPLKHIVEELDDDDNVIRIVG